MKIPHPLRALGAVATIAAVLLTPTASLHAMDQREFIDTFIENYRNLRFEVQVKHVKKNKELVDGAIKEVLKEAMAEELSFEEKMYLLDVASAMAYMNKYWNDADDRVLREIEALIRREIHLEEERLADIMKWKKEERFLGNFVMKKHMKEMEAQGLSPVLYPHWVHRIWFECKVCHQEIFTMKRWTNSISHEKFKEGKQCAACHNGKLSFSVDDKKSCDRCHMAGKPDAEPFFYVSAVDNDRIKKVADRIGSVWRPENLPGGKLPLDRFKFINWLELKKKKVFEPLVSLHKDYKEKTYDTKILFNTRNNFVNNVLFDHKIHSDWIKCSVCHPSIFKDKLGGNRIRMRDMSGGRFCGHCHGKVSFTFADCLRCHNTPKGQVPEGVLNRVELPQEEQAR